MSGNPLHMGRMEEKKLQVKEYLETPIQGRMPLPSFRKLTGIRRDEFLHLKFELQKEDEALRRLNIRNIQENLLSDVEPKQKPGRPVQVERGIQYIGGQRYRDEEAIEAVELEQDPEGWWKKKQLELNKAILASAKNGNAQSQKLAKQLAGELIEKSEVRIDLSADDIAQRNLRAERELREIKEGRRVAEVPPEPPLLPE